VTRSISKAVNKIVDFKKYVEERLSSPPFDGEEPKISALINANFRPEVITYVANWQFDWLKEREERMMVFNPDSSKHMAWMRKLVNFQAQLHHVAGGTYPNFSQPSELNVVKHDLLANFIVWYKFFDTFNTTSNLLEDNFKLPTGVLDYFLEIQVPYGIKIELSTCFARDRVDQSGGSSGIGDDGASDGDDDEIVLDECDTLSPDEEDCAIPQKEALCLYSLIIEETRPKEPAKTKDLRKELLRTDIVGPGTVMSVMKGGDISMNADIVLSKVVPDLKREERPAYKDLITIMICVTTSVIVTSKLSALEKELGQQRELIDEKLSREFDSSDDSGLEARIDELEAENTRLQKLCSSAVGFVASDLASHNRQLRIVEERLLKQRAANRRLKKSYEELKMEDKHKYEISTREELLNNYHTCLSQVERCNRVLERQSRKIQTILKEHEAQRVSDRAEDKKILEAILANTEEIRFDQNISHLIGSIDSLKNAYEHIERVNKSCKEKFKMKFGYPYWAFAILMRSILAWVSIDAQNMRYMHLGWKIMEHIESRLYQTREERFQERLRKADDDLARKVKPLAEALVESIKNMPKEVQVESKLREVVNDFSKRGVGRQMLSNVMPRDLNYENGATIVTEAMRTSIGEYTKEDYDRFYDDIIDNKEGGVVPSNSS
jgi:hypothetical protein